MPSRVLKRPSSRSFRSVWTTLLLPQSTRNAPPDFDSTRRELVMGTIHSGGRGPGERETLAVQIGEVGDGAARTTRRVDHFDGNPAPGEPVAALHSGNGREWLGGNARGLVGVIVESAGGPVFLPERLDVGEH